MSFVTKPDPGVDPKEYWSERLACAVTELSVPAVTFLPEGVIVGFQNFAKSQQNKIRGKKKLGEPHCPRGSIF